LVSRRGLDHIGIGIDGRRGPVLPESDPGADDAVAGEEADLARSEHGDRGTLGPGDHHPEILLDGVAGDDAHRRRREVPLGVVGDPVVPPGERDERGDARSQDVVTHKGGVVDRILGRKNGKSQRIEVAEVTRLIKGKDPEAHGERQSIGQIRGLAGFGIDQELTAVFSRVDLEPKDT
jgi:hypothetical protein